jgi:anti-anti-sigma factor
VTATRTRRAAATPPPRLALAGELDIQVAAERKAALMAFVDGVDEPAAGAPVADLELDLHEVSELDTAGLQLLLLGRREAARRGLRLVLVDPSPAVTRAFALVNLALDGEGDLVSPTDGSLR